jgi:hypothetical protein
MRRVARLIGFFLGLIAAGCWAAESRYGTLPPGARSVSELSDVAAEICRDHLFDPATTGVSLPAGYRWVTVEESAKSDPAVATFLREHPQVARYALGSVCFLSVGRFLVDGVSPVPAGRTPMAFWWARVEGPRDGRMRGPLEWIQLASWYSREVPNRAAVLATDPTAEFVDLAVDETKPGVWRLHLALDGETLEAEVSCHGEPEPRRSSADNFMSVAMGGKAAGQFWVITYFGHHHRPAAGTWRATGRGVFTTAWQIPGEAGTFGTLFQSGWSALSGLYATPAVSGAP